MTDQNRPPSPQLFMETVTAYQRTAALRAAIDLGLFTAIGSGKTTAAEIAEACQAAPRGIRILSDYLTIAGFLTKQDDRYQLTPDTAVFLDQKSPAYMGGVMQFMNSPTLVQGYDRLTEAVRQGGTTLPGAGTVEDDHPVWRDFARAMMPLMQMPAQQMAAHLPCEADRKLKVLDIAAGHGIFGITLAQQCPGAEVVAQDWPLVLEVATENARRMGVGDRHTTLPGSAFEVDFGTGYDIILITNFFHHFDIPTCETLMKRVHAALAPDGRAVTLDFVPNDDRVTPPDTAAFSLVMLASTRSGDAYTFAEYDAMFRNAGFSSSELIPLPPLPNQMIVSTR